MLACVPCGGWYELMSNYRTRMEKRVWPQFYSTRWLIHAQTHATNEGASLTFQDVCTAATRNSSSTGVDETGPIKE